MARITQNIALDGFAFYELLRTFYQSNRKIVRREYKDLTKKFLDFNEDGFLRIPQFEALEMYVFLKEGLGNAAVAQIFRQWREQEGIFQHRDAITLFEDQSRVQYDAVFAQMQRAQRAYPNYIFALTMGTGKTILMATCIFYDFLLANKFPLDPRFCHNALVFAPDKTVLQSLREIESFDLTKVVPPEYVNFLTAHLKFHFLDEAGTALSTLDKSRFNLVISNTQKIILKKQHAEKTPTQRLFDAERPAVPAGSVYAQAQAMYDEEPDDEDSLTTNQRYQKLQRLGQLGIYVDEAHHAFGANLAKDMGANTTVTSLRRTIDELAGSLSAAGTRVVACYNYTGTPYVGREILPEVIYAYGLNDAIRNKYLKNVTVHGYSNPRTTEFVGESVKDFLAMTGGKRYEGMLPKMAFFAATIDELTKELRPAVEDALTAHGIPIGSILVNVGDDKLTSNDDIREFNRLDTPESQKQFILLVNKGREGWNCRSLFAVALFRKPKSKIFVLQATMRCLRSITDIQQTGQVYLSGENKTILEDELQQNFRVNLEEISAKPDDKRDYEVRPVPPPVTVKLKRIRKRYEFVDRDVPKGFSLGLKDAPRDAYKLIHTIQQGIDLGNAARSRLKQEDLTAQRTRQEFTTITLVAEVARYLNRSPLKVEELLDRTAEGISGILTAINEFNELLYDWVIPHLVKALYDVQEFTHHVDYEVELVKSPPGGFYQIHADPALVKDRKETLANSPDLASKSFHLDHYCFDSGPERDAFWSLIKDKRVWRIYFTGMLTHGQSDFFVQYIDPETHVVRTYYPDFLIQEADGSYIILEVKANFQIEDAVVKAKRKFADEMAVAGGMRYVLLPHTDANAGRTEAVFAEPSASVAPPRLRV